MQILLFTVPQILFSTLQAQLQVPSKCDPRHRGRDSVSQPALWGQTAAMPMPNIPNYLLYFRDDMRLSTWILWGAVIQSMLVITLPHYVALLPAVLMLGSRIVLSALTIEGFLPYNGTKTVVPGRSTAQIPNPDGTFPAIASAKDVCIFIIATRSNHPKGRFAPGLDEITNYFRNMWQDVSRNREKWGC